MNTRLFRRALFFILVLAFFCGLYYGYSRFFQKQNGKTPSRRFFSGSGSPPEISGREIYFCPFCGLPSTKDRCGRRPVSVMVENHRRSRPQSGLSRACMVYEAPAEGGITRFMAVFAHQDAETIGPVRSARAYFIDWSLELNSVYVHCGQSWDAFEMINSLNFPTINEMWRPEAFWRSRNRFAPHNLYTSSANLRKVIHEKMWQKPPFGMRFDFSELQDGKFQEGKPASRIAVKYLPHDYKLVYAYDKTMKAYARAMDGVKHGDALTGKPLLVKNIVFQYVQTMVMDEEGRLNVQDIGDGVARLVKGGKMFEGSWRKNGMHEPTQYTDLYGKSFVFLPGQTFIQIVPLESEIVFK